MESTGLKMTQLQSFLLSDLLLKVIYDIWTQLGDVLTRGSNSTNSDMRSSLDYFLVTFSPEELTLITRLISVKLATQVSVVVDDSPDKV